MYGLTIRWSLEQAPADIADRLRAYVTGTSLERLSGMPDLSFTVWRMAPGAWFEGTYVFDTDAAREAFLAGFEPTAATSPGSQIIGSAPVTMERYEVVAVAEGDAGFVPGPGPGTV